MATTVKSITRTEVSFWWHKFFIREGFYYGELLTKDSKGELEYTHFVTNGNVHDKRLPVYFHIGTPKQTQKWVFVGDKQHPYGVLGRAYWKKRSAYDIADHIVRHDTFYSVQTKYGRLFYTDHIDAWCVYDGEVEANGYAILTEHHKDNSIVLAEYGTEV